MDNSGQSSGKLYADDLTWREQDILILLAERLTNQEIANRLHLAESTVKDYVGKILSKLYVKNRREAVEVGRALGLLDQDKLKAEQHTKPIINLPAESTTFVGRLEELGRIKCQIKGTRLLTLAGPGGIGKTRLALKAAETCRDDFKDGIFFVPLAPIRSAEDILQTIAESLKFPIATQEDPRYQLLRYLEKRQLLLLMDNYEHLLDGVGIISEIIQTAPEVKVLVTSRERLNLQSETVLYVGGMRFPDQAVALDFLTYDAINLFIQSASKVRPGYCPSEDEVAHIINICHIIGGVPLAIELAAAWLHILRVEEIFVELKKGLDILSSDVRDIPTRHSSIRTVFDHSWGLIDHHERETFTRLSVFRGGFTREAALQVAGATLLQLTGLVSKSFLSYDPESGRLRVHELLRQYAEERLNANPEASLSSQESHALYYADFMQKRWEDLKCIRQMQALAEIEADIENIRAAWRHCLVQKDTAQIWKFIYGLWHFHWIRWWNHAGMELFAEAARVLEGAEGEEITALWALARALQSYFMAWLGLADQGYEIVGESVAILEQMDYPVALVFAYDTLGISTYFLFHYEEEIQTMEKMVEVARGMDDQWLLAMTLFGQGMAALVEEDFDRASQIAATNLKLYEGVGDTIGSTQPLIVLGHAALGRNELEIARSFYLRCLELSQETGFYYAIQTATKYLAKVSLSLGKTDEAEAYLLQSLRITVEIGFIRDIINLFYEYARLQAARGNLENALELLALVVQHPASKMYRMMEGRIRDSAKGLLLDLEAELPPEAYEAALERGRGLGVDEVVQNLLGSRR